MDKIDKMTLLIRSLWETYTEETFNPDTDFKKSIMEQIIRHDADELFNMELNDIELNWIVREVKVYEKTHI